jgi:Tfp pilus assembly protein PilX
MKNDRGSALVMMILVMMAVMILGTTVMSISLISYKMKKTNTTAQANLYLSESGLDEAVAITKKTSDMAIEAGNNAVENFYSSFSYEDEIAKEDSPFITDGELNSEYLEGYVNTLFQNTYKIYIINNLIPNLNTSTYTTLNGKVEEYRVEPVNENVLYFYDDKTVVNMESEVINKGVKRRISGDIVVNLPSFSQPFKEERVASLIYDLPIFNQALAADGDVYLRGKVNIKGNVYAEGSEVGVSLESEGSSVSVTENICTGQYIRLLDSDTTLYCSNIYSNNIDISADNSYIHADGVTTKETILNASNINSDSIKVDITEAENYINTMGELNFKGNTFTVTNQYEATNNKNEVGTEYIFVSSNPNDKNIYLLGEEFSDYEIDNNRDIGLYLNNEEAYKGIIVTRANVYIKGSINFEGLIMSFGNIDLDGNGVKDIKNNKRVIYKMIEDDSIKTEFITENAVPKGLIQSIKPSMVTPSGIQAENNIDLINWNIEY